MILIMVEIAYNYRMLVLYLYQVKAGLQKVLQVFITNSTNVFLLEAPENSEVLEAQV